MKLNLDDEEDEDLDDDTPNRPTIRVIVGGLSGVFVAVFVLLKLSGVLTVSWWWILLCLLCE